MSSKTLRWTAQDLAAYQARIRGGNSAAVPASSVAGATASGAVKHPGRKKAVITLADLPAACSSRVEALQGEVAPKPKRTVHDRVKDATVSVRQARVSGSYLRGSHLDIVFEGAQMLSTNDLYSITHFQRVAYRKAWHQAIADAVLQLIGGPRNVQRMERFKIVSHRQAPTLCDTDALNGYFKYPIDGLRYVNVVAEDNAKHFLDHSSTQSKGPHCVRLRIEDLSGVPDLRQDGVSASSCSARLAKSEVRAP